MKEILRKTKFNELYRDDNYLYLRHIAKNKTAKMNYSEKLAEILCNQIDENNFTYVENLRFYVYHKTKPNISLAKIVYAVYHNVNTDHMSHIKFRYVDDDKLNLTYDNLQLYSATVSHDDFYIYIDNGDGCRAYTDYEEDLYKLLKSFKWYVESARNRFITIYKSKALRLHTVIFIYAHRGCRIDNFDECLEKFRNECKGTNSFNGKVIDHKQSEEFASDNTFNNLQLITSQENSKKHSLTSNLPDNFFYIPLNIDEQTGAGEIFGTTVDTLNIVNLIYFLLTLRYIPDIAILNDCKDYTDYIDEQRALVQKNILPDDVLKIKTSIAVPILHGVLWLALKAIETIYNKTKDTEENIND